MIHTDIEYTPEGRLVTVDALGGADVTRHPIEYVILIDHDGRLRDARYGEPLAWHHETVLLGWGPLDGPAAVIGPRGVAWDVCVPADDYLALLDHA